MVKISIVRHYGIVNNIWIRWQYGTVQMSQYCRT